MIKAAIILALMVLAQIGIVFGYVFCIAPANNFPNAPFDLYILIVPALISSIPAAFLPTTFTRPGDVILWYLYVICVLPYGVLSILLAKDETFNIGVYALVLPFIALALAYRFTPSSLKLKLDAPLDPNAAIPALGFLALLGTGLLWVMFKPKISFDLYAVYDRRHDAREILATGTLLPYVVALLSAFAAPILISFGMFSRKHLVYAIPGVAVLLFVFFYNGTKTSLFLPLLMIVAGVTTRHRLFNPILLLGALVALLWIATALELIWGANAINELFVRRIIVTPVYLFHSFIEFFSVRGYLYFADINLISTLFAGTQTEPASILVGEDHLGLPGLNANTGAIPYGFAEAGVLGGWIFAGCIYLYMIGLDLVRHRFPQYVLFPLALAVAFRFSEQAFQTSMLTGGLFFILLFLFLTKEDPEHVHETLEHSKDHDALPASRMTPAPEPN